MSTDGEGTKWRRKIAENVNRLSRVHKRYRQTKDDRQTDGTTIAYSEREREFTFAKNVTWYLNTTYHVWWKVLLNVTVIYDLRPVAPIILKQSTA